VCQPAADYISCFVDDAPPKSLLNLLYFSLLIFHFVMSQDLSLLFMDRLLIRVFLKQLLITHELWIV
jgi:hypothetical protein